jgi:CxxC-x17-CxxC domain-containing protein
MFENEKVVETKVCRHCSCQFDITDKDLEFYEKVSPSFPSPDSFESGLKKYLIPAPTLCPDCRQQRRLSWRNERKLYKRKCDASGKEIISMYSPDKNYRVYERDIWISDKWNPLDYGLDFNIERSFFSQFHELMLKVPRKSNNLHIEAENSNYCNQSWYIKDSYLCFNAGYVEGCCYSQEIYFSKKIMDSLMIRNSELCYQSFNCDRSFYTLFSSSCNHCSHTFFSYDCEGCDNIFMCQNLKNKNYCIKNKQFSKEEYFEKIKYLSFQKYDDLAKLLSESEKMKKIAINKENNNLNTEKSTGDYLNEVKNSYHCFNLYKAENCKFVCDLDSDGNSCYDMNYLVEAENCYEGISVTWYNNIFCNMTIYGKYNYYCDLCSNCENCFACISLEKKSYCILNKQYTKEAYEKLVPKIIEYMQKTGEWWEFFSSSISPFGYNETVANEYFSISLKTGLKWEINYIDREWNIFKTLQEAWERPVFKYSTYEAPFPKVEKIIPASKLPQDIEEIPDDILNWAIECEITKKPFRIIKQELEFYRKHNLPIPKKHPDQRHLDRMKLRNPRKLFRRICDKCGKEIQTTYAPERKEIVYCEECYNKEIYKNQINKCK